MEDRYLIFRYYIRDDSREVLESNLTWKQVVERMADPESAFDSAKSMASANRTAACGPWWTCWDFDRERKDNNGG